MVHLRTRSLLLFIVLLSLTLAASAQMPWRHIRIGEQMFRVEVAESQSDRARGLMYRESLGAREGMLFIQPSPGPTSFWMKNTLIPLDMLFYDGAGRLLARHLNVPPCTTPRCPTYPAAGPVRYIVELSGGTFERLGLDDGDRLRLD